MKKIFYFLIFSILMSLNVYSQITPKTFVGLNTDDSLTLTIDSSRINRRIGVSKSQSNPYGYGSQIQPQIPNSFSIDKNKDVGEIPMTTSMNNLGATSINIPIEILQNPNGLTPNISLQYNSLGDAGVVGMGWTVSGISVISPVEKSFYFDGKTEGVNISDVRDAAFSLDGNRLIKISEETGKAFNYITQNGNIKITATLTPSTEVTYGYVISYFKVFYPNGTVAIFRRSVNKIDYLLTDLNDQIGNSVYLEYDESYEDPKISKIKYGKSSGLDFYYLSFNYELVSSNTSIPIKYIGGKKIETRYLLKTIRASYFTYNNIEQYGIRDIWFDESIFRTYTLNYSTRNNASVLASVDCEVDGKQLNPLKFYYGDNDQSNTFTNKISSLSSWYTFSTASSMRVTTGKLEYGTGNEGLIMVPNKASYAEYYLPPGLFNHSINYIQNLYPADLDILITPGLSSPFFSNAQLKTEDGFIDIFSADLNTEAEDNIIKINNTISNGYDKVDFHVYKVISDIDNNGKSITKKYTRTFNFNTLIDYRGDKSVDPKFYFKGNFKGDGKTYILGVATANVMGLGNNSTVYLFDLEANKILYQGSPFNYYVKFRDNDAEKETDKLFPIDYDGDGKTDLCYINGSGTYIYTFDVNATSISMRLVNYYSALTKYSIDGRDLMPGEFNGDGKTDLLLSPTIGGGSSWKIYSSKGNGSFEEKTVSITTKITTSKFMLQDMNGDGQTDLIETYGSSDQVTLATYFISNETYLGLSTTTVPKESIVIPSNLITNSGKIFSNKLLSLKNDTFYRIKYNKDLFKDQMLTGAVNSYGVIDKFEYCRGDEDEYYMYYKSLYVEKFPYKKYKGEMPMLWITQTYVNNIQIASKNFMYRDGVIHQQGLGFCGFQSVIGRDLNTGKQETKTSDPYNFGILKSSETDMSSVAYDYNVNVAWNKVTSITLKSKTEKAILSDVSVTTTYPSYDSYGNPTKEIVDYGNGIKTTSDLKYNNLTATNQPYILGQVAEKTITNERNGNTSTSKTEILYNVKGQVTSNKQYYGNNLVSEEVFAYDTSNKQIEAKSRAFSSPNWLVSKYQYDYNGYMIKETDPFGLFKEYQYDWLKGTLKSEKNHKGQEIKYEYDNLGRKIKATYPDGVIETTSIAWASSPTGALTLTTTSATGQAAKQSYTDALGREIRSGEIRFDGKYMYIDKKYDAQGRLYQVSLPFKGASPTLWNTYAYDNYDRIISLTYASGKKDNYSYNKSTVTATVDGIAKATTYDAIGKVISVTDPAGTITYNLRADGQPSSIVSPGNVTTSVEYDGYGRQTKIIDPSAGTKTFAYDAAGNINQETDANGKVTKMTYDTYNRITKKEVVGELSTDYAYNTDNQLTSASSSNNTSKSYTYDQLMRLSIEKGSVPDGKWLQKIYTYANGNTVSKAYTSNTGDIATENYVYTNGTLSEVKLNNITSIWKLTQENDLGLASEATTGILTRTYGYDAYGMPTARAIKNGAAVIQNFGYNFNAATGNMNWRKDNNRNIQENFGYDNLNRLTDFGGKKISYDLKGNITDNSTIGKFEYNHPTKPYAITDVTPYGTDIPQRNQSITYNGMMRPVSISETINVNTYAANLTYNSDAERVKMQIKKNNVDELTRYYIGGQYETDAGVAGTKERLYLDGDAYSAAAVYIKDGTGAWTIYYIGRDYQGSITHLIDGAGAVKQELSYDPWGRLRNPADQKLYAIGSEPALLLGRGYTGHEHLTMFGLINMNARLYDPVLGRFLSPDPYVQSPDWSQNFNRYTYAMNNPLRYTDENGEVIFTIICIIVPGAQVLIPYAMYLDAMWMGAAINVIANWNDIQADGGMGSGKFWGYAGLGAVNGLGAASGQWWVVGITGVVQGGGNTWLRDGHFSKDVIRDGAWNGLVSMGSMGVGKVASPVSKLLNNAGLSQSTSNFLANYAVDYAYHLGTQAIYYNAVMDQDKRPDNWLEQSFYNSFLTTTLNAGIRSVNSAAESKSSPSNSSQSNGWKNKLQNARDNYNPSSSNGYSTPQPQWSPYSTPTYKPNPVPSKYFIQPKR